MVKPSRQTSDIRTIAFLIIGGIVAIALYFLLSSGNGFTSKNPTNEAYAEDSATLNANRRNQNGGGYYAY